MSNDPIHPAGPSRAPIAAIVLAAGGSTRMGTPKTLLPFGNKPMIVRVVEALLDAGGIDPAVIVTGHEGAAVARALAACRVACVPNPAWATGGMLSSLRCGLAALAGRAAGIMVVLGDQPAVRPATLHRLVDQWHVGKTQIVLPTCAGRRGHPVIFDRELLTQIESLLPNETLRDLVHRHSATRCVVPVDDPAVIADVDTPEDYRAALAQWDSDHGSAGAAKV